MVLALHVIMNFFRPHQHLAAFDSLLDYRYRKAEVLICCDLAKIRLN